MVCRFLELFLHCSAVLGKSSGSVQRSSWCHRPGSFPGFALFPDSIQSCGLGVWCWAWAQRAAPGAGLFHWRGIQLMFAEPAPWCELQCTKWSLMHFVPKALWIWTEMVEAPLEPVRLQSLFTCEYSSIWAGLNDTFVLSELLNFPCLYFNCF